MSAVNYLPAFAVPLHLPRRCGYYSLVLFRIAAIRKPQDCDCTPYCNSCHLA